MSAWLSDLGLGDFMTPERLSMLVRVALILLIGLPLARLAGAAAGRAFGARLGKQESMLARRIAFYGLAGLTFAAALNQLGFNLSVLLGAAGILTVALGFASQTSASNLISGIFLIAERPFVVGDVINVEGQLGEVLSIDLLSVKLRTFDNLYVRVPNESIIKTRVTNLTHFPIRRFDIDIGVAYREDVGTVVEVLADVADKNPYCLDEPEPIILFKGFGDSALQFLLGVWFAKADFLTLRNSILRDIKERFDAEGIEIPFPHRTLYAGSATDPFPVRVVSTTDAPRPDPQPPDATRARTP